MILKNNHLRYDDRYTPEDYLAVAHLKPFQNARFLNFINRITKRRKYKPSRHIIDWKKSRISAAQHLIKKDSDNGRKEEKGRSHFDVCKRTES